MFKETTLGEPTRLWFVKNSHLYLFCMWFCVIWLLMTGALLACINKHVGNCSAQPSRLCRAVVSWAVSEDISVETGVGHGDSQ